MLFHCIVSYFILHTPTADCGELLRYFHLHKQEGWIIYDMIYLLTAIGLTPGGSRTVDIYTQTIHRTTKLRTRTTQLRTRTTQLTTRTT